MITSEKGFKMQQWYYMKETMFGEEQVGPVADEDFKKLVYNGKLQPGSKIFCPTRTQGKWVFLKTFPSLLKLIKHGAAKREETKRLIKEQDRNIKNARKIARLEEKKAREQAEAEYNRSIQESKAMSSQQDTRRVGEYRRTCRACGKVWHSLKSRESQLKRQEFAGGCDVVGQACNPGTMCSPSARLQATRNQEENRSEIVRLKRCPECNSSNYDEVVV
ncbi:hypothetical protein N9B68_01855 [bacterium]|nr:hypothetical protein [bacterium]